MAPRRMQALRRAQPIRTRKVDAIISKQWGQALDMVNLYSPSSFVPKTNRILAEVADAHENVCLVDWHATVAANPALLQSDQTHPTRKGSKTLAQLILKRAQDFCAEARTQEALFLGDPKNISVEFYVRC